MGVGESQTFLLESSRNLKEVSRYISFASKTVVVTTPVTEMMVPCVQHNARDGRMALQKSGLGQDAAFCC
jgi:hypothetical protein